MASGSGLALNMQACSGAKIVDVKSLQLAAVTPDTGYVTITVGGNDIGFSNVVSTCLGTNTTACLNAVAAAVAPQKLATLRTDLAALYASVKTNAPSASIVATSYPRLFNGKDCSILTSFTSAEMTQLNSGADALAATIALAASDAGISYADVRTPFVGHAVCSSSPWIVNASLFKSYESFHPNATGHSLGYKPQVAAAFGPIPSSTESFKVTTRGVTSSDTTRGNVKIPKSQKD